MCGGIGVRSPESGEGALRLIARLELFRKVGRSSENILPELENLLPNAGFVIEACVDPREPLREDAPKH